MLKSDSSPSKWSLRTAPVRIPALWVLAAFLIFLPSAFGQDFTLAAPPLYPDAVNPGGTAYTNITVGSTGGFNGDVALTCQVTGLAGVNPPACQVSPASVAAAGGSSVTITTLGDSTAVPPVPPASPGLFSITITGTATIGGSSVTHSLSPLSLTVLAVSPQFTVTVGNPVTPNSVPAGNSGVGTININPLNGYSGTVTLSCSSIAPLVTVPPICSFNPKTVTVSGISAPSTLTIVTQGPTTPVATVAHSKTFFALWLPLPMLALMGLGAATSRKGSRKVWGLLALFMVGGALLLMPACGNTSTTSTTAPNNPNGVTPNNTYTLTLLGVDANGVTSSNTGTGSNPTVTLTVTSAPKP